MNRGEGRQAAKTRVNLTPCIPLTRVGILWKGNRVVKRSLLTSPQPLSIFETLQVVEFTTHGEGLKILAVVEA
jgi:hypothetical protein